MTAALPSPLQQRRSRLAFSRSLLAASWRGTSAWVGDLIRDDGPVYTFTVDADGPFGPVPTLTYVVDLSQWRESANMPGGSLHLLTKPVEKLTKEVSTARLDRLAAERASQRLVETRQRANGEPAGEPDAEIPGELGA